MDNGKILKETLNQMKVEVPEWDAVGSLSHHRRYLRTRRKTLTFSTFLVFLLVAACGATTAGAAELAGLFHLRDIEVTEGGEDNSLKMENPNELTEEEDGYAFRYMDKMLSGLTYHSGQTDNWEEVEKWMEGYELPYKYELPGQYTSLNIQANIDRMGVVIAADYQVAPGKKLWYLFDSTTTMMGGGEIFFESPIVSRQRYVNEAGTGFELVELSDGSIQAIVEKLFCQVRFKFCGYELAEIKEALADYDLSAYDVIQKQEATLAEQEVIALTEETHLASTEGTAKRLFDEKGNWLSDTKIGKYKKFLTYSKLTGRPSTDRELAYRTAQLCGRGELLVLYKNGYLRRYRLSDGELLKDYGEGYSSAFIRGDNLYVTTEEGEQLYRLDARTGEIQNSLCPYRTGRGAAYYVNEKEQLYVCLEDRLYMVDETMDLLVGVRYEGDIANKSYAYPMAISMEGDTVVISWAETFSCKRYENYQYTIRKKLQDSEKRVR